ncbi:uncharacterized protein BDZ83DRAFT_32156 [Colletotrichum acutatum]|uniref:Uncharacterized protein n=1 Tax=Glomerella acutata TaxID=27357 RepID=A0AAD8XL62_GLOAC|nr:uncharacterized protein BDZ83DRAFT_32156 [Colletotrichum acutatum]KAK1729437.1 hypothetical protein BDZ83DRAFT_32156 [Colletotrichum acutatum]
MASRPLVEDRAREEGSGCRIETKYAGETLTALHFPTAIGKGSGSKCVACWLAGGLDHTSEYLGYEMTSTTGTRETLLGTCRNLIPKLLTQPQSRAPSPLDAGIPPHLLADIFRDPCFDCREPRGGACRACPLGSSWKACRHRACMMSWVAAPKMLPSSPTLFALSLPSLVLPHHSCQAVDVKKGSRSGHSSRASHSPKRNGSTNKRGLSTSSAVQQCSTTAQLESPNAHHETIVPSLPSYTREA